MGRLSLTEKQQRDLYRDGFVVLKNAVPRERVEAARRALYQDLGSVQGKAMGAKKLSGVREAAVAAMRRGIDPVVLDLFNKTIVKETVEAFFGGPVPAARGAQLATNFPSDVSERTNEYGYRDCDTPFYGWCGHLDGLWNGAVPVPQVGTRASSAFRRKWYQEPSRNGCLLTHPDQNCNITNFTALVGIALSDQRLEGAGNLGLLKGAHREMGKFFDMQRKAGGPMGPDGPGWPRENTDAPNGHGLRHYPDAVRQAFAKGAEASSDGHLWPKPTLVKVAPGDAVIVHFNTPHSATRVAGPDPRFMVYYRTSPNRRREDQRNLYPRALYDIWHEWRGMRDYVRQMEG